jgi:NhaA family Na+:H+ antiporter
MADAHFDSAEEKRPNAFERFVHSEVFGSAVLLLCTIAALFLANSRWSETYLHLLHTKVGVSWGDQNFALSLHLWINDGLMAVFFFVVGLELKRELLIGHLSSAKKAILPVMAALGGMIAPALIYSAVNLGGDGARGWGIPMATDIAFSIGVLAILGTRVPIALKVFLTAAAIADDLGAVLVIALFYTETIRWTALVIALLLLCVLFAAARVFRVRRLGILLLIILGVWIAVFFSGIHATVAGIMVALVVPVRTDVEKQSFIQLAKDRLGRLSADGGASHRTVSDERQLELLQEIHDAGRGLRPAGTRLENYLHPVQAYFVLPLFALANAGVVLDDGLIRATMSPVGLGVFLGLFLGKPIGFLLFSWLAVRSGRANLPEGVNWRQMGGIGCLAGIGFTMSLFVTELAFKSPAPITNAKAAILLASIVSAVVGSLVLSRVLPKSDSPA